MSLNLSPGVSVNVLLNHTVIALLFQLLLVTGCRGVASRSRDKKDVSFCLFVSFFVSSFFMFCYALNALLLIYSGLIPNLICVVSIPCGDHSIPRADFNPFFCYSLPEATFFSFPHIFSCLTYTFSFGSHSS